MRPAVLLCLCITACAPSRLGRTPIGDDAGKSAPDDVRHAGRTSTEWAADLVAENEIVRLRAARSLGYFGASALSQLAVALENDSPAVRYVAASLLGDLGAEAKATLPALKKGLEREELAVRISFAYAVASVEGESEEALQVLSGALEHRDRGTANSAAEFLGRIGPAAESAVPALETAAKHRDYHVKNASVEALRRIRGGDVY